MDKKTEALKLALEALNKSQPIDSSSVIPHNAHCKAITAIREALAEQFCDNHCTWLDHHPECDKAKQPAQQQEPVAWLVESKHGNWAPYLEWSEPSYLETQVVTPLYTSPTAIKPWVGLTAEEKAWCGAPTLQETVARVEAKLKDKNA